MDLIPLYALGLQAIAVVALVYVVAILGARAFADPESARPPRRRPKSRTYNTAPSR